VTGFCAADESEIAPKAGGARVFEYLNCRAVIKLRFRIRELIVDIGAKAAPDKGFG
jgi:hypothetical protein